MLTCTFSNNWGGRTQGALLGYIANQARNNAVMAFTEVNHTVGMHAHAPINTYGDDGPIMVNQFGLLEFMLSDKFTGDFQAENAGKYTCKNTGLIVPDVQYGSALFISCDVKYVTHGSEYIFGRFSSRTEDGPNSRVLQYIVCEVGGNRYLIAHFHGIWIRGNTKGDAPERIQQSVRVLGILDRLAVLYGTAKVVFGGDFNLDINTMALRMLERGSSAGNLRYRNLIREYNITNTRTPLYRHYSDDPQPTLYADYVLVSEAVQVHRFTADNLDVSDHRPLEVTFR